MRLVEPLSSHNLHPPAADVHNRVAEELEEKGVQASARNKITEEGLPVSIPPGDTIVLYGDFSDSSITFLNSYVADVGIQLRGPGLHLGKIGCRIRHPDGTWLDACSDNNVVKTKDWLSTGFASRPSIQGVAIFNHKPFDRTRLWALEISNQGEKRAGPYSSIYQTKRSNSYYWSRPLVKGGKVI